VLTICQILCNSHADLINLATRLIALVQAFDAVAADQEALAMASDKFQDLLKVLGNLQHLFERMHPAAANFCHVTNSM